MAIGQIGDLGNGGTEMHGDAVAVSVYANPKGMALSSTSSPPHSECDHSSTRSKEAHRRN